MEHWKSLMTIGAEEELPPLVEDLKSQVETLQKSEVKLNRQLRRMQETMEREKTIVQAKANLDAVRTAEQEKQEKYMKLLLENSPDIILLFDKEGRFSYCTDAFLHKAHIASFEAINGRHFREVFRRFSTNEWVERFFATLQKSMEENTDISFEESMNFSGGKELRKYEVHFTPMAHEAGNIEGALMLLHDITDLEQERECADQARTAAERASAAKSEFLANMSHEMRTPMNAIIGMTNIARASSDVKKKDYCLGKIDEASNHLLGVINDILDMSKIEANKFDISCTEFNFEKMLMKMANVINFRVDEKRQVFNVRIDGDIPPTIICDEQRLSQVVANLLSNAVKFTPENGTISLSAHKVFEENDDCLFQIEVADSGIGVTEEQKGRLFRSFEQADSSTSRKFGGTGLGLAISKKIVEMMNGKIWVDSELGKGSTFAFQFHAMRGGSAQESLLAPGVNWDNMRVLLVDDSAEVRDYFSDIAGRIGIHCDIASSGDEACRFIEQGGRSYDVYFVDWKMPGMDGIELSRRIGGYGASDSVIIMISGADWSLVENEARNAGVDKFIQKPLFASSIADCINQCLGVSGAALDRSGYQDVGDRFAGFKILLVEDVAINREILLSVLESTALEIVCAENGLRAVEAFTAAPDEYDMIFMDVQMPEMDGYEATRRIRAMDAERARMIPIVAMTANVFREDIEKCIAAGMNDHVGKPLDFDDVMEKLKKYLFLHRRKREVA
ncbi:MAG: response regulator [Synergistaceae bacterium]|jgi:PAS domain S-box-containing protein|nr:response regulator [Synergistaceae bacterium]